MLGSLYLVRVSIAGPGAGDEMDCGNEGGGGGIGDENEGGGDGGGIGQGTVVRGACVNVG